MNLLKTEYRIEIWKDEWNGSSWDETKVVEIGAHDMEFLGRAYQPILSRSANGEITFSFNMYTRYVDPETGIKEDNYLIPYLFNEVKVKLYCPQYNDGINGGWFDFIIKDIKENRGKEISFSYSCQFLPINELAKTGQSLTFSMDLNNSTGKITELAAAVLNGTEWTMGAVSADLTEAVEETLFSVTTTSLLNLTGIDTIAGTPTDIANLPSDTVLYVPYYEIINTTSTTIQVIYIPGTVDDLILANGNVISNKLCNYTIPRNTWGTPTYDYTPYRGYRIVSTYQVEWNSEVERYVTVYEKSGSNVVYYGYLSTEVISDDPLDDLVVGEVQHYFYYDGTVLTEADNEVGLTPVIIPSSEKYRTLEASKSNRFNLIQSIAELFEVWARFDIAHDANGRILSKQISFVDTIGSTQWAGFTYGVNLVSITRNIISKELATKMFVTPIENDNLSTGACSIAYSNSNISGEEFLINLDYYSQVGLIPSHEELIYDLYTINGSTGIGYLTNLGILNDAYNSYNDLAISLDTYIAIYEENVAAMTDAIAAAQEVVDDLVKAYNGGVCSSDALLNYQTAYPVAVQTLADNQATLLSYQNQLAVYKAQKEASDAAQASILAQKVLLDTAFNNKYSRFLQEGIWEGDKTYTNNDAYYYDAQNVLLESSRPNVEYTIDVVDLAILTGYEDFNYNIGDITYIEDVEYFGYTTPDLHGYSRPYREQVIIAEIESNLDSPKDNKITIRNYKNQFDELFQRVTATVQSYSLNEDIYARANNFTATGEVTFDALQSALINNSLILSRSKTEDVLINKSGITLTDLNDATKMIKIVSGGIFVSNDTGTNWKTGITGDGINTNLLLAGQIDVGKINIISGSYPSFSWDSTGLYAYKYAGIAGALTSMDNTSFVRFNQDGIYGQKTGTKMFSLDWDGLYLKTGNGAYDIQLGAHPIGSSPTTYLFSAKRNSDDALMFYIDGEGSAMFKGIVDAEDFKIKGVSVLTEDDKISSEYLDVTSIAADTASVLNAWISVLYAEIVNTNFSDYITGIKVTGDIIGNTSTIRNYIHIENQEMQMISQTLSLTPVNFTININSIDVQVYYGNVRGANAYNFYSIINPLSLATIWAPNKGYDTDRIILGEDLRYYYASSGYSSEGYESWSLALLSGELFETTEEEHIVQVKTIEETLVKSSYSFFDDDGDMIPKIQLGVGTGVSDYGKSFIYKITDGFCIDYCKASNGDRMKFIIDENGIRQVGNISKEGIRNIAVGNNPPAHPQLNDLWINTAAL